mmetsp:Transcript_698/g.1067  ORF Transcript_698/g.1067 Transcript_698/m.1067 type:complete len:419 (+) Transcript_698:65-1321(+)
MADDDKRTDEEKAASFKDEGNAKFKANDFKGAIELYTSSLELNPKVHTVYSNRSASYMKLGNHEEALADAQKCIELDPAWAKGYNRVAAAYQGMKLWDKAIETCKEGLAKSSGESLEKLMSDVEKEKSREKFTDELLGVWHGTVSKETGGFDQEIDFAKDSLRVSVLGQTASGMWWIEGYHEPQHLMFQVQPPGGAGVFVPPQPYIGRIDEEGLHLCCPYLTPERPTEFAGPGYCIMKRGKLVAEDTSSELEGLSRIEKLRLCIKEFMEILPNERIEEPKTEKEQQEFMMAQVAMESKIFKMKQRFGEACLDEVMEGSRGYGSLDVRNLEEMKSLLEKLKKCGMVEDEASRPKPAASSLASSGPKVQAPAPEDKRPSQNTTREEAEETGSDRTVIALSLMAVAVVASLSFVLWRRQKR